jgi:hypothetical protein
VFRRSRQKSNEPRPCCWHRWSVCATGCGSALVCHWLWLCPCVPLAVALPLCAPVPVLRERGVVEHRARSAMIDGYRSRLGRQPPFLMHCSYHTSRPPVTPQNSFCPAWGLSIRRTHTPPGIRPTHKEHERTGCIAWIERLLGWFMFCAPLYLCAAALSSLTAKIARTTGRRN